MKKLLIPALQTVMISTLAVGSAVAVTRAFGGPAFSINQVSTNKQSTFDVTGESKITTIPDQAEVRMGISINESTVKAAQDKANTVTNAINTQLAGLGIEKKDIKTENYSLYPNYDYQNGTGQRIVGYSVNANLVVTIKDFAILNQAIDTATQVGANQIGGITFTLSDEKRDETEKEARKEAIENAKKKASELSRLAGMRLGSIVNVYESPMGDSKIYPMMAESAMMDARGAGGGSPTNVEPGSTTYSYSVTLSYETL